MIYKKYIIRVVASWGLLLLLLVTTKPDSLPIVLLLVPFALLFAALYNTWALGLLLWQRAGGSGSAGLSNGQKRLGFSVCGLLLVLLVARSLGELTARDVITLVLAWALGSFYLMRLGRSEGAS